MLTILVWIGAVAFMGFMAGVTIAGIENAQRDAQRREARRAKAQAMYDADMADPEAMLPTRDLRELRLLRP